MSSILTPKSCLGTSGRSNANGARSKRIAIVTGGTRGIGRGIVECLAETGEYHAFILNYVSNDEAAKKFVWLLNEVYNDKDKMEKTDNHTISTTEKTHHPLLVELVKGDITEQNTRDCIFDMLDEDFSDYDLAAVIHNAGQYVGVTSENWQGLKKNPSQQVFGDGSLLDSNNDYGKVNFDIMRYYQKLYGEAYVDLCERGLVRMRRVAQQRPPGGFRGTLVGISAPGCNSTQPPVPGYSMSGAGKSLMEYSVRIFALSAASIGVNCNVIIPGITETEAWEKLSESNGIKDNKLFESMKAQTPMNKGEPLHPKDIGDVVAFLGGHGGGRFITGQSLVVDGGLTMKKSGLKVVQNSNKTMKDVSQNTKKYEVQTMNGHHGNSKHKNGNRHELENMNGHAIIKKGSAKTEP